MKHHYTNWPVCRCEPSLLHSFGFNKIVSILFENEGGGKRILLDTCFILMY